MRAAHSKGHFVWMVIPYHCPRSHHPVWLHD
jgi:hypothetical protein